MFEATGNRMPAAVPAKGKHLFRDVQRWAQHYGVPVGFPKVFPVNSVLALRAGIAASAQGKGAEFALAVMRAYWADGARYRPARNGRRRCRRGGPGRRRPCCCGRRSSR